MKRLAALLIGLLLGTLPLSAVAAEKLKVSLNFTVEGWHGPWFLAKARGYFADAGLDVSLERGFGSVDTVKRVVTGVADVGFADPVPIIMAIAGGQALKAVMGGYMKEPCALYSVAEHANAKTPKDMEGKTIGGNPGDICVVLLEPVMEKAGADFSKVKVQNMDAPTRIPLLVGGRLDAAASFYEKEALFGKAIKSANKTMVTWRYDRYIDKYSVMVVVGPKLLDKPAIVRKLTLALLKGYQDHLKDPEAGAAAIMSAHPEFDRDYIYPSARLFSENAWDETAKAKGIGILNADKMQKTIDLTAKYWKLPRKPSPQEVFTNEFIEWAHQQLNR